MLFPCAFKLSIAVLHSVWPCVWLRAESARNGGCAQFPWLYFFLYFVPAFKARLPPVAIGSDLAIKRAGPRPNAYFVCESAFK